jgi:hypothetical protein
VKGCHGGSKRLRLIMYVRSPTEACLRFSLLRNYNQRKSPGKQMRHSPKVEARCRWRGMRSPKIEPPSHDAGKFSIIQAVAFLVVNRQQSGSPIHTAHVDLKGSCETGSEKCRPTTNTLHVARTKSDHGIMMVEKCRQYVIYSELRITRFLRYLC